MPASAQAPQLDMQKLNEFMGKFVTDLGAAMSASLILLGDELGLYRAMDGVGTISSAELAEKTGTHERCVREWLAAQAASGYVSYDENSKRYYLAPEQAFALAQEDSPAY